MHHATNALMIQQRLRTGVPFLLSILIVATVAIPEVRAVVASDCVGDCDANARVTIDELVVGIGIALETRPVGDCSAVDRNSDGSVTVEEIVAAVRAALESCESMQPTSSRTMEPSLTVTATPSLTQRPTDTESPTPSPTQTPLPTNQSPVASPLPLFRGYPGNEIQVPIGAIDPDGDDVRCVASDLPNGAELDEEGGLFRWTPSEGDAGPRFVSFTCADQQDPPGTVDFSLPIEVKSADTCLIPTCSPESGCEFTLKSLSQSCCGPAPSARWGHALVDCPDGGLLEVGRNNQSGFGPLQNCDRLRIIQFAQIGANARFSVRARCVPPGKTLTLRARLETRRRVLFDLERPVLLRDAGNGYVHRLFADFPVTGPGPFFDL